MDQQVFTSKMFINIFKKLHPELHGYELFKIKVLNFYEKVFSVQNQCTENSLDASNLPSALCPPTA